MWITGGDGWDVARGLEWRREVSGSRGTSQTETNRVPASCAVLQQAAVFNLPLGVVVAQSFAHYLALPKKYKAQLLGKEHICEPDWLQGSTGGPQTTLSWILIHRPGYCLRETPSQ